MENSASLFKSQFQKSEDFLEEFSKGLAPELVSAVIQEIGLVFRSCIYTPFVTLFACLGQVLNDDHSYKRAVFAVSTCLPKKRCSMATGGLVLAKARLPLDFFRLLSQALGRYTEDLAAADWLWPHGVVKVVDGTCFTMADTPKNALKFGRPSGQKVGFPTGRLSCVFSLTTGALLDLVISPYKGKGSGESSAIAQLWRIFKVGETLLGDALYSTFPILASALQRGVHVVSELPKRSHGRLNKKLVDQTIRIKKPKKRGRPHWISIRHWTRLPDFIDVRIIKLNCAPAGFRSKVKFLLTTHLSRKISPQDIVELYRQRWQVELNLRSIKTILGLDFIRAKSPDMVEKDVWLHMLGYNLVRFSMTTAGLLYNKSPLSLSFRAAQQALSHLRSQRSSSTGQRVLVEIFLRFIAGTTVGLRPNRFEPRAIKRRQKNYALLSEKRSLAKTKLHKKYKGKRPVI